ncbi:very short patch repair endonuclease [Methanocorpusculum bavaricum]|jgi:DNA mismatch endonuclease (patch repair protein)|uniref:very short patch repair endonuclease n=1 Tax=Methanocorpusculum bavaricum TaxID=71518 RepID=UPI0005B2A966|nr:very short patch repair endonuclease [Methanocorpusculum bavaricum]MDY3203266.1 very short patch repair endonuclease [Methanocorpusculum sp.]
MTDVLTPEQRKKNMSRIHGKNTSPELKLRKLLWKSGLRGYRVYYNLPGKPDIVFTKQKLAIFVDGCFWHKCPVCFRPPATNGEFWNEKLQKNVERDLRVNEELQNTGWTVLRIWEHEIKKTPDVVVGKIRELLRK